MIQLYVKTSEQAHKQNQSTRQVRAYKKPLFLGVLWFAPLFLNVYQQTTPLGSANTHILTLYIYSYSHSIKKKYHKIC